MRKLYLGADHHGFALKEALKPLLEDIDVMLVDCGATSLDSKDDYPDFGIKLAEKVVASNKAGSGMSARGLLLCRSGIGMAIAANKVPGALASLVTSLDPEVAILDRQEHDPNILVLSADNCNPEQAFDVIKAWLEADFAAGRHLRRMNKIKFYEQVAHLPYWTKPLLVPIALMSEDETEFRRSFAKLKQFAPLINIDIASAEFVGANTLGDEFIIDLLKEQAQQAPDLLFTLHLMLREPQPVLVALNNLPNLLLVYVHAEASPTDLNAIRSAEWSFQLGLTLNPETQVEAVDFNGFPVVQLMSTKPGAQGNSLVPETLAKAETLRQQGFAGQIHFDGSVNEQTLPQFLAVKPDVLNIGSAVVKQPDPRAAYFNLVNQLA